MQHNFLKKINVSLDNVNSKRKRTSKTISPIDQKRKKEIIAELKPWLRREGEVSDRNLIPFEVHRLITKRKFHYEWSKSKLGKSKINTVDVYNS